MNNSFKLKILASLISIVGALLVGVLIIIAIGQNPMSLFDSIFTGTFGSPANFGNWLAISTPLILTGLGVAFAYNAGLFNIGAEGQFQVATMTTMFVAVWAPFPPFLTIIFAITLGTIAGGIWGLIPGFLKAYYKINEVVVTIMLNWIAFYCSNYFIKEYFHDGDLVTKTPDVPSSNLLDVDVITNLTDGSRLNLGFLIAIIAAIIFWIIIDKTVFGFEIKAVGHSPSAAEYAGINSKKRIMQTMFISGAFAGLAGAVYALSSPGSQSVLSTFRGFGFDGIAVALLGQINAFGTLIAGLLLGALRSASVFLQVNFVPKEIADILIGVIILFSALSPIIIKKLKARKGGDNE